MQSFLSNSVSCGSSLLYSGMSFLIPRPKSTVAGHCPVVACGVIKT